MNMNIHRFYSTSLLLVVTTVWIASACTTIDNCDVCATSTSCSKCSLHYGLTTSGSCQRCDTNIGCSFCTNLTVCDVCRHSSLGPDKNGIGTCSPCARNCVLCTQIGGGLCDTCNLNYTLTTTTSLCSACPPGCSYCSLLSPGNLTCRGCSDSNYFLNGTTQLCQKCSKSNCAPNECYDRGTTDSCYYCNIGYYRAYYAPASYYYCAPCAANCGSCYDGLPISCRSCYSGYGFDKGTQFCAQCDVPFCDMCSNNGTGVCDQCLSGYVLSATGLSCTAVAANENTDGFQTSTLDGAMIGVIVLAIVFGLVSIAAVIVIVMLWKKLAIQLQLPHQQQEPRQQRQQQKQLQREQEGIAFEIPEVSTISHPQNAKEHMPHKVQNEGIYEDANINIKKPGNSRLTVDFNRNKFK